MAKLVWDAIGEHFYETGVDHVVLYRLDANNAYSNGYAWNGVSSISESPPAETQTRFGQTTSNT